MVCNVNGDGSWCFAGFVVVGVGVFFYGLWVMLADSNGEELMGRT